MGTLHRVVVLLIHQRKKMIYLDPHKLKSNLIHHWLVQLRLSHIHFRMYIAPNSVRHIHRDLRSSYSGVLCCKHLLLHTATIQTKHLFIGSENV